MRKKEKCRKKLLNRYPCDEYLHNALLFMRKGMVEHAYIELCYAIYESGGHLVNEREKEFLEKCARKINDVTEAEKE